MYSPTFVLIILTVGVVLSLIVAILARRALLLSAPITRLFVRSGLASASLLAVIAIFLFVRLHTPKPITPPPETLTVTLTFSASLRTKELLNVPFSVTSSPVNVDCDQTQQIVLPFRAPVDTAVIQEVHALWINTDNVNMQNVTINRSGPNEATALGIIRGIPRNFVFNCPGGGHGQLAMQGTYSYETEKQGPDAVIGTIHESVPVGSHFVAMLPPTPSAGSLKFDLSADNKGSVSHMTGAISDLGSSSPAISITQQSGPPLPKPAIDHTSLVFTF